MSRHRLRMGAMSLLVLSATRMRRMFAMYFSIVLLSADCAAIDSDEAVLRMTTDTRERRVASVHAHSRKTRRPSRSVPTKAVTSNSSNTCARSATATGCCCRQPSSASTYSSLRIRRECVGEIFNSSVTTESTGILNVRNRFLSQLMSRGTTSAVSPSPTSTSSASLGRERAVTRRPWSLLDRTSLDVGSPSVLAYSLITGELPMHPTHSLEWTDRFCCRGTEIANEVLSLADDLVDANS